MSEEENKRDLSEKELKDRLEVLRQYECGEECRLCPFPGAKCVSDPEVFKTIK